MVAIYSVVPVRYFISDATNVSSFEAEALGIFELIDVVIAQSIAISPGGKGYRDF